MKSFKEKIYFHREKEDNWDIAQKAQKKGFVDASELRYLGSEIEMTVEIFDDCSVKVLKISDIDVSDKEIFI